MIKEEIAEIIRKRIRISEETDDNWDYGIEQCWKKYIEIIIADIDKSIAYFFYECTDEEFFWLSEAFEEISEKAQSKNLIAAWCSRLARVTPNTYCQKDFQSEHMRKWVDYSEYVRSVGNEIDYAEGRIKE